MEITSKEIARIVWAIGLKKSLSETEIKALANYLWLSIYPDKEEWKKCPQNPFK